MTSYAEMALTSTARRPGASGLRQAVRRDRVLGREHRPPVPAPAAARRRRAVGGARAQPRGPGLGPGRMGNRSRALHRPRADAWRRRGRSTAAPSAAPPAWCSIRSAACASACGCRPAGRSASAFSTGVAADREAALRLAQTYHHPNAASRTFALAFTHAQSLQHHLGVLAGRRPRLRAAGVAAALRGRVDAGAGAPPSRPTRSASRACGGTAISGDLPIVLVRVGARRRRGPGAAGAAGAGVLAAEGPRVGDGHRQRTSAVVPRRDSRRQLTVDPRVGPVARLAGTSGRRVAAAPRCPDRRRRPRCSTPSPAWCCAAARRPARAARSAGLAPWRPRRRRSLTPGEPLRGAPDAERSRARAAGESLPVGLGRFEQHGRAFVLTAGEAGETPAPWSNVIANAALRHARDERRRQPHVGGEQPREPAHAVCQRPGERPDGRGHVPARRRHRRRVDADARRRARRDAASRRGRASRAGRHDASARTPRDLAPRARGLRGRRGAGQVSRCSRSPISAAAARRLSVVAVLPVGARSAARRPSPPRRDRTTTPARGAVFARPIPSTTRSPARVAFLATSHPARAATGDRAAFLGRHGTLADAGRLCARACVPRFGGGLDPCAALEIGVVLGPGESRAPGRRARPGRGRRPRAGAGRSASRRSRRAAASRRAVDAALGRHARHGAGAHARRLVRHDDEHLAALPDALAAASTAATGLLPAGRRLRLPRSAPGRAGALSRPARRDARASAAGGRPAVRRRRRAALVARAVGPRPALALLGRSAVAALCGRASTCGTPATTRCCDERVPFLDGAAAGAPATTSRTTCRRWGRQTARCSITAVRAVDRARSAAARTACRSSAAATGTTA